MAEVESAPSFGGVDGPGGLGNDVEEKKLRKKSSKTKDGKTKEKRSKKLPSKSKSAAGATSGEGSVRAHARALHSPAAASHLRLAGALHRRGGACVYRARPR